MPVRKEGLMFPKTTGTKKRKQHPKSIMHRKEDRTCYLCVLENNWTVYGYLEEHHIFFSKHLRALSEKYGLKVYLCPWHHRLGPLAVHKAKKYRRLLEAKGQQAFESLHGHKKFLEVFGENYWYDDEVV